ncbi:DICT sensory domain-containing protein [Halorarum halobium]|uniref:DICT sensory domain-containing protein n=1 Tax=Halorarum halobium TaxID=3075121 RepID=UPI0028A8A4FF|nr:DICT sensory domain-containing protein [Halobaculum sp. XH14]
MPLTDLIEDAERGEKRITVFDPPTDAVVAELREYVADQQVRVDVAATDSDLSGYAVLSDERGDEVLTAVDLRHLGGDPVGELGAERTLSPIFEELADTTFTSYDVGQMIAASREIEDRAWRTGVGELHAGFQTGTALSAQTAAYRDLAAKDLDVHVYCTPDTNAPHLDGVTVHAADVREIRESWFVVFDGGGEDERACALLAEERGAGDERAFYGFWTYDPAIVADALEHLWERYHLAA